MRQEIADGLVEVERRDGKVFVTVGSGGAFPSGTADLTSQAQEIIQRISFNALTSSSKLTVTGHTDNVPISGGLYRDNWDLAAARAASVVQAVQNTGMVAASNLQAVSKGENDPVASNDTAAGRELNRGLRLKLITKTFVGKAVLINEVIMTVDYLSTLNSKGSGLNISQIVDSLVASGSPTEKDFNNKITK